MPGMDGVQLVQAIHERDESLPVILLTAHGSERVAVQAMKSGAYDYLTKPFDAEEFSVVVDRALEARTLRVQNRRLTAEKALGHSIVGDGPAMSQLIAGPSPTDRKSTRLNSSHLVISYAVLCLKKKKKSH